ncbi:MAG: hypothetical protein JXA53_09585 [Bacteroidales bacterium]|nr:hypothetical protein [Bacteroidales bacterium]
MRTIVFSFIISFVCIAGFSQKKENVIKIDSTKTLYELIVIDPGFDSWYELKKSPANYKMEEYYKHWNQRYSIEWNILFRRGDKNVDSDIDYRIDIDYGFEFQHKLYFYFKFWEEKNKRQLITTR